MQHFKPTTNEIRDKQSLEEGFFLLQSFQSFQNGQYLQYNENQNTQRKNVRAATNRKSVSSLYEGQSFPFRLYHLINNEYFDDVIHWSADGNSLIIPSVGNFVIKVLKRPIQRIFKTESMKSFVRQLNLYGFHKVSLEKDDAFAYLRVHGKDKWPDAVFNHSSFIKNRPDLLDHVKRRCKVKLAKALMDVSKNGSGQMFDSYQLPSLRHCSQTNGDISFPNVLPPSETSVVGRKEIKRKLKFLEEKEEKNKKQIAHQSPFFFYPSAYSNLQPVLPPPGWPFAQQNQMANYSAYSYPSDNFNMVQSTLGVQFVRAGAATQPCTPKEIEQQHGGGHIEITPPQPSCSNNSSVKNKVLLSPLDKFCAELFQPGSLDNTPSKNIKVGIDDDESQLLVT